MGLSNYSTQAKKAANRLRSPAGTGNTAVEYKYHDAIDFPAFDRDHLSTLLPVSVYVEPPGTPRKFSRYPPEFVADPDGVGLFSRFAKDTITYPPAFIVTAKKARVVGFRTVLSPNGFFFNDNSVIGPQQRRHLLMDLAAPYPASEETGFRPTDASDRFVLDPGERPTKRIRRTTVLLASLEPSNYGSWLFRVLPKLHTLAKLNLPEPLRYLAWVGFPSFMEYLNLLGISEDQVIHQDPTNVIYHLERVIVPSMRNNQAFLDPESVALFASLRARLGALVQPGCRIYVSRMLQSENGSQRIMQNEPELIEQLVHLGFRIVTPETLSVAEQITEFSSAEMVVGPSGSGMFNVVFCHPGTKVIDIESEPHWIHAHRCLFTSCRLRYGIFVGNALDRSFEVHHQPWKVNIDGLISQIKAFAQA